MLAAGARGACFPQERARGVNATNTPEETQSVHLSYKQCPGRKIAFSGAEQRGGETSARRISSMLFASATVANATRRTGIAARQRPTATRGGPSGRMGSAPRDLGLITVSDIWPIWRNISAATTSLRVNGLELWGTGRGLWVYQLQKTPSGNTGRGL